MNTQENNQRIIERYLDQPSFLPDSIRTEIENLWGPASIQLYALADLNSELQITTHWVLLGATHIALVTNSSDTLSVTNIARSQIKIIREDPGLSCTTLRFLSSENDAEALITLHYTHRQRKAVENIKFILEEALEGRTVQSEVEADAIYSESVSESIREAQAAVAKNKMAVIWRLLGYFKPYKREVIIGSTAALILTLAGMVPPFLTGYIIDEIVKPVESGTMQRTDDLKHQIIAIVGCIAFIYIIREFCVWVRLRKMAKLGEYIAHDLRRECFNHLQKLSMSFFSKKQTGSLISRVSSDTDRLWEFLAFGVVETSLSVITLIALAVVLMSLDLYLGLVLTLPIPLFLYAFYLHGKSINKRFLKAWRKWSDVTAVLSDTIPGMRVVKAFNQEEREKKRFGQRNASVLGAFNEVHDNWTTFWPLLMFSFHTLNVLVWALALPRLLGYMGPELSPGTFIAFLLYMGMFMYPLEVIGQVTRTMNRAVSSAHRVFEIMDTEPQYQESDLQLKLEPALGNISFQNVSFSYDGIRRNLKNISFDIQSGEMIGLVGPSGAGKSTITNLLAGFYQANDGTILIDDKPITDLDMGHYRQQIGMVLQEPFLFHETLIENIRYGHSEASYEAVVNAARAANAHDFICKLPMGYETVVGERGHTLSGGERQRISIARAILHNPRILILDEATSNVDTETEQKIQEALNRLIKGRTVVAIAHRLSTLKKADRLLVMKDGALVEQGTHTEVLNLENGVYRKLHNLQQEMQVDTP